MPLDETIKILVNKAFTDDWFNKTYDYPMSLIDSAINNFLFRNTSANKAERNSDESSTVRISLPFKDQVAANAVRKQLRDLSHMIGPTLQPVFS